MRTTVDIDDRVLAAVRAIAQSKNISLGRAISELAERGLEHGASPWDAGFPTLPKVPGHVITEDMVEAARDDG